jgi:N-acetylmuramic acid 6-phosphate (MurNAc-6-P) etherase
MSKKPAKAVVTTATIEEQTAAFLKSGGAIQYVVKGTSGQIIPAAAKPISPKTS